MLYSGSQCFYLCQNASAYCLQRFTSWASCVFSRKIICSFFWLYSFWFFLSNDSISTLDSISEKEDVGISNDSMYACSNVLESAILKYCTAHKQSYPISVKALYFSAFFCILNIGIMLFFGSFRSHRPRSSFRFHVNHS